MPDNLAYSVTPARFGFDKNWRSFIDIVDEARIRTGRYSVLWAR